MNKKSIKTTIAESNSLISDCEDMIKDDEFNHCSISQKNEIIDMYKQAVGVKARMEIMLDYYEEKSKRS
jgi:hypothetical protein